MIPFLLQPVQVQEVCWQSCLLILTEATRSSVSRKEQEELQEWEHGYSEEMPPPAEGFFGDTLSDLPAAPFPSRNTATVQAGFLPFSIPTH